MNNIKLIAGILSIFVVITVVILNTADNSTKASNITKLTIEERLKLASSQLNKLNEKPNQKSLALISFNDLKQKDISKEMVGSYDLEIKRLFHAHRTKNNVFRGGYIRQENETLDTALDDYQNQIKTGVEKNITDIKQRLYDLKNASVISVTDNEKILEGQKTIEAMGLLLADYEDQLAYINKYGLQIYGMQVLATNNSLNKLSKNPEIKSVEVLNSEEDGKAMPIFSTK